MILIDRLSGALAWVAGVLVYALIGVMIYEVIARYMFGAPTIWAGDLTYMFGGASFMLAAAYGLKTGGHVSIDFLALMLPERLRDGVQAILLLFALPAVSAIAWVAANKTWTAYERGTTDPVSAFAPLLWPFYAMLSIGLIALALQILASVLRATKKAMTFHG